MTKKQEAKILVDIYNSLTEKRYNEVKKILPKTLHFVNDTGFVMQLRNVKPFSGWAKQVPLTRVLTNDKFYDIWYEGTLKDLIYLSETKNILVEGVTNSMAGVDNHEAIHLWESLEFKHLK